MRALFGARWEDRYLDYHREPGEHRLEVTAWLVLSKVDGLYFVREPSFRTLVNYTREIGLAATLAKVRSRRRERFRNDTYVACGVGRILEAAEASGIESGEAVVFVAARHPSCVERLVLQPALVAPAGALGWLAQRTDGVLFLASSAAPGPQVGGWWDPIAGYSPHSGDDIPSELWRAYLARAQSALASADWGRARILRTRPRTVVMERIDRRTARRGLARSGAGRKRAVLFGYGNYAKTIVLPSLPPSISLETIHELDPAQAPISSVFNVALDTKPTPREDERYDIALIAAFHHMHAPLAIEALRAGSAAVVEKPLVVDRSQLRILLTTMRHTNGRLFGCFHKRYSPLNGLALQDLGVEPGQPIGYHCIVYEVPLPPRHWYRWSNSRSRVISNGCHWLDHFLYLNEFATVRSSVLDVAPSGTVSVSVTLSNSAFFTMTLTDEGSPRLGVREYVELCANGRTVRISDGASYSAEDGSRVLRRRRVNKLLGHRLMYRSICERITHGDPGDTVASVETSSDLVLSLEEELVKTLHLRAKDDAASRSIVKMGIGAQRVALGG